MPRPYSTEFRRNALDLVADGARIDEVARDVGVSSACLYRWHRQELIDTGQLTDDASRQASELAMASKNVVRLKTENDILRRALAFARRNDPARPPRAVPASDPVSDRPDPHR